MPRQLDCGAPFSELVREGPRVQITVSGGRRPGSVSCDALVDTGANRCFIDISMVRRLGLRLVDVARASSVLGQGSAGIYLANIRIDGLGHSRKSTAGCADLVGAGWSFRAIVGRDFLAALNLDYDGPSGRVKLTLR